MSFVVTLSVIRHGQLSLTSLPGSVSEQ